LEKLISFAISWNALPDSFCRIIMFQIVSPDSSSCDIVNSLSSYMFFYIISYCK
jgi:hypothetical protein